MKSCFVISPIGAYGSEQREHADDVFDFIIKPATERAGYAAQRADHEARPGTITEQMYDRILGDDLLIAILTYHNPNVFYEIAIAEAAARPLILLIENSHLIPFDIKDRRVIGYDLKPRSMKTDIFVEKLASAIAGLEASGGVGNVPFRPSLKPLGSGETAWRMLARAEEVTAADRLSMVAEARTFLWYQGIALFSFAKLMGFEEVLREALSRGVEVRVLLMHPDNPALSHLVWNFSSNYLETIRGEITSGAEFWKRMSSQGPLNIRFHQQGAMFGNLQQNDVRALYTQYCLARPTSDSPTISAPAGSPFYRSMRQDFEWTWQRALPSMDSASPSNGQLNSRPQTPRGSGGRRRRQTPLA